MFYEMLFGIGNTPWPCRDINSYLLCIKTIPLRFPKSKPIKQITENFLRQCLCVDEKKRINWKALFKHPMLII